MEATCLTLGHKEAEHVHLSFRIQLLSKDPPWRIAGHLGLSRFIEFGSQLCEASFNTKAEIIHAQNLIFTLPS